MKHIARSLSYLVLLLVVLAIACRAAENPIILDGRSRGNIFQGIGALSAGASSRLLIDYPEPFRGQILDYLFKPGYGAALQHLKVEIGADVNSTDGSEPSHMRSRADRDFSRGYEWWLMEEARKRNPKIILDSLPWGAPGWIGSGHFYSEDMAEYVADFIVGAKTRHNLDIAYTGVWNEKQFDATYIKDLHTALNRHGLDTKIVCCDMWPGEGLGQWSIIEAMHADAAVNAAVAVVGVHYPWVNGKTTTSEAAKKLGKPLWSSEDQPNSGGGPILSRDWDQGGKILARQYNRNYLEGHFTKTEIWSPITSYYDILAAPNSGLMYANTPWSGHYNVQSAIWVTAHTTQFAQPGWQYLDQSSGYLPHGGSYVALKSTDGKNWSVVLETIDATQPQHMTFKVSGGLSTSTVHVWETNRAKSFEHVADLRPERGSFSYTFDPGSLYSFTTTTGQGKGTAEPPTDKPFPFPYRDNFEATPLKKAPRYLSDQDGAFEVHPCLYRTGKCLQQMIVAVPIPWDPLPDPWTLAGNVNWSDYRVSTDVLVSETGPAALMGRIDSANGFRDRKALYPSGYVFLVSPDGAWKLFSKRYTIAPIVLASGKVKISTLKWQRIELKFQGKQITASLDGKQLAQVVDDGHTHGMIGLGTGWNSGQFDNLSVSPID
jgi:O-glycosyl hydrolase